LVDARVHTRHVVGAARRDDPPARGDRIRGLTVDEHRAVAEQLHESEALTALADDGLVETVDQSDRRLVPLAVHVGREVLQVAEQEGDLHGARKARVEPGLRLPDGDLRELVLHPSPVDADDQRVRERQQTLERCADRRQRCLRLLALGTNTGLDVGSEQPHLRLRDARQQPPIDP
jgi:hypothetical protein